MSGLGGALRIAAPALVGVLFLAIWQALVASLEIPVYVLPSPLRVAQALVEDRGLLFGSLLITLKIAVAAFVLAVVLGVLAAFIFVQSRWLELSLFPYAVLLQVTPVVAIAPLIIIWVDNMQLALVICATIVAVFPVISNTTLGLRSVDTGLLDLFRLYKAGRWQVLMRLRVPSALPHFFGGMRIASGLALIGAVVSEFIAGTGGNAGGLAYQILIAGFQLNIPRLFAALFLIAMAGVLLFMSMVWLSRVSLRQWHESEISPEG